MPWGTRENPSVNPMTKLPPKIPSVLIRTLRYTGLILGFGYGWIRFNQLKPLPKEIIDREKIYFEYNKARVAKFWSDKTEQDRIALIREVDGLPRLEEENLKKPLLIEYDEKELELI